MEFTPDCMKCEGQPLIPRLPVFTAVILLDARITICHEKCVLTIDPWGDRLRGHISHSLRKKARAI
jgi:hypothetical protein